MSRKHFQAVGSIADMRRRAQAFAQFNPNFDHGRFVDAAGKDAF